MRADRRECLHGGGQPPTLLAVDDADLNVTLLADLVRAVGYWPPGSPPVRLLLLARHTTGWWDTLNQSTGQLAGELADPALELHDGELAPADRLPDLLDQALQLAPQPGLAAQLAGQMPEHSVLLAALAATLTSQQVTQYRADALGGEPDAASRRPGR